MSGCLCDNDDENAPSLSLSLSASLLAASLAVPRCSCVCCRCLSLNLSTSLSFGQKAHTHTIIRTEADESLHESRDGTRNPLPLSPSLGPMFPLYNSLFAPELVTLCWRRMMHASCSIQAAFLLWILRHVSPPFLTVRYTGSRHTG